MNMKQFVICLYLAGFASAMSALEYPSKSKILNNGLKVIVCEKPGNDFVEMETWYRTGSKDEKPGIRGMAHLFEHMMFRGTVKHPGKSVFETVESVGGTVNAYTTWDRTVYHEFVPTSALEKMMDLEADRMSNLVVTQDILNTEREVVGEELRNGTNSWYDKMYNDRYPFLYPKGHPYEVNVIGFLEEITQFSSSQCMDFYNNYYSPNNAFLVVVGNVKSEEVFALAEKYFAPITKQLDIKKRAQIPSLDTARVRTTEMEIFFPVQIYSFIYPRPAAGDKDFFTMEMLTGLLFTEDNSILKDKLIKKDHSAYVVTTSGDSWTVYPNLNIIDIVMSAKPGNSKVKTGVREEIQKVINDGFPQEMIDNYILSTDNANKMNNYESPNIAVELGISECYLGDYNKAYTRIEEYKKISREDLKRVAARYLSEDKLQFINIKPE
jgi:zinc protease